jgi:hypothetical protein
VNPEFSRLREILSFLFKDFSLNICRCFTFIARGAFGGVWWRVKGLCLCSSSL